MPQLNDPSLLRRDAYVGGQWLSAPADARFAVSDPATGKTIAEVADFDGEATERAIEAAHAALPAWRDRTAKDRANLMRAWRDLIMAHQDDLALLMTTEQGKPLAEASGEVAYGASFIEWFAEEGKRILGEVIPTHAPGKRVLVFRQAIGVVGAITPWNFPIATVTRKAAPALAAGCTAVIKPAPETPLCALALAELAHRAGIPAGVFNVVPSNRAAAVGEAMTTHPKVRKFTFTGSTAVGKLLMQQCASTVKKVSLELGGNAPFIVFDDADLDAAIEGVMLSKFRNTGQTCICANRILVQDDIYDAFAERLAERIADLNVGNGLDDGVMQGPLITGAAVDKVERLLTDATDKGARVRVGGQRHALGGTFFQPTLIEDVTAEMAMADEEIFGPVAALFRFRDEADAIQLANATEYGLAAYFYSRDLGRAFRVSEALEYGMVGVNEGLLSTENAPFGGVKQSGIGREGSHHGIEDFTEMKYVLLGGIGA